MEVNNIEVDEEVYEKMIVEVVNEEYYRKLRKELDLGRPYYEDDVIVVAKFKDGREERFFAFTEDIGYYVCGDYLCLLDENGEPDPNKKAVKVIEWW